MFEKKDILLVTNNQNEIDFFKDALMESGIPFMYRVSKSVEQAFVILRNYTVDLVFVNVPFLLQAQTSIQALKQKSVAPIVPYITAQEISTEPLRLNYVQLPQNAHAFSKALKNLLAIDTSLAEENSQMY